MLQATKSQAAVGCISSFNFYHLDKQCCEDISIFQVKKQKPRPRNLLRVASKLLS